MQIFDKWSTPALSRLFKQDNIKLIKVEIVHALFRETNQLVRQILECQCITEKYTEATTMSEDVFLIP